MEDERIYRAKKFAAAHGYYGLSGGWIYRNGTKNPDGDWNPKTKLIHQFDDKPLYHGWMAFYNANAGRINLWFDKIYYRAGNAWRKKKQEIDQ